MILANCYLKALRKTHQTKIHNFPHVNFKFTEKPLASIIKLPEVIQHSYAQSALA